MRRGDPALAGRAPGRRGRGRILRRILVAITALVLVLVVGVVAYSRIGVMAAEPEPLAAVRADSRIVVADEGRAIVLSPATGEPAAGLVYIPGAKVDPWAYAAKLSGLVAEGGLTVVITRPTLNLAILDVRPLAAFTDLVPEVDRWIVGGHSLGGVRACRLAADADALALFASYCANDLSALGLPVLSIGGSEDGLSTPSKIAASRHLLPSGAESVEIEGAGHSSFGDYGSQRGDGVPVIPDEEMTARLTDHVDDLAGLLD